MKKFFLLFLFCLSVSVVFAADSQTAEEALEQQVRVISHKLRCPTCQSMSVKDSEAGLSLNMKAMVKEQLIQGKSEEEILQFFVDRYGEWILREPSKTGFNLLLWTLPGVLLVLAFIGVIWWAKLKSIKPEITNKELTAEEQAEIDQDMQLLTKD